MDKLFVTRAKRFPSPDIILAVVDNATVDEAGQWPLPRSIYADVLDRLTRAGAKTIAFDIVFANPSLQLNQDTLLAAASRKSGRVIQAAVFDSLHFGTAASLSNTSSINSSPSQVATGSPTLSGQSLRQDFRLGSAEVVGNRVNWPRAASVTAPLPMLQQGSAALGHVSIPPDSDGSMRSILHIIRYQGHAYPSLPLATAAHYLGLSPEDIAFNSGAGGTSISLGTKSSQVKQTAINIPVNKDGKTWVNWCGPAGAFPTFTFNQLLDDDTFNDLIANKVFKDRIVVIGVTATAAFEFRATPFSSLQAAVELQANALNDILLNRPLHELPGFAQFSLVLVLSLLAGAFAGWRGAVRGALFTLALGVALCLAALAAMNADLYIPIVAPLLASALACSVSLGYLQLSDAKQLMRTVQDLQRAEERYALAVRGANDGLWDWDITTDRMYFSPRWKEILGYSGTEIGDGSQEWFSRIHPSDLEHVKEELALHLKDPTHHFESEHRVQHKDGNYRWVLSRGMAIGDRDAAPHRMSGSLSDISERKAAEQKLQHNAFHDILTDLPNRALFLDRLLHALEIRKRREEYLFAVLFLDIDRFKMINDSLGHLIGDQLLIKIAQRLQTCLRPADTIARLGGDEFAVILEDVTDLKDVTIVTERIHEALKTPFVLKLDMGAEHEVITSSSIGIAMSTGDYEKPDDLLRDADTAMYRAKAQGPSRSAVFDQAMHEQVLNLLQLESALRRAVDTIDAGSPEFSLFYQPIVALGEGHIAGFEALIRWHHPERGLVSPAEFIPLAEDTGLIVPMSRWILREACSQLHIWHQQFNERPPIFMSVNLSAKQLAEPNLIEEVSQTLGEFEIDPATLKLEITESAIMDNVDAATIVLKKLEALGLHLSIDDFGTGYSSLSYLHKFPLDTLKIDRSFVSRMEESEDSLQLVWAIVALARNLRMEVTAEGLETNGQLDHLRMLTCDYGQGYFFSKPVDRELATALLEKAPHW
jgi:diguanylate cyclase (GGDEF)-like protein/PAS domain S-box-containing protein